MALQKKLTVNNIEVEYWKIAGFNTSVTGKLCQIFLIGYQDKETREDNKNIASKNYMIKREDFDSYISIDSEMKIVSSLYEYLKEKTDDFKDAEDI